jgi:hypothetical protein
VNIASQELRPRTLVINQPLLLLVSMVSLNSQSLSGASFVCFLVYLSFWLQLLDYDVKAHCSSTEHKACVTHSCLMTEYNPSLSHLHLPIVWMCGCVDACVDVWMHVWMCGCVDACVEVRGGDNSRTFSFCEVWDLNSGHQTWQQSPLPAEPCHQPRGFSYLIKFHS